MKEVYQTIFKPPLGNCLQACIASLLELPLEGVPNFMEAGDDAWWAEYSIWMIEEAGVQPLGLTPGGWVPHGWHLIVGSSPRGDWDHVVVGFQGNIVHDPYPDGEPLLDVKYYEIFVYPFLEKKL